MTPNQWAICRGTTRHETELLRIITVHERLIHGANGRVCLRSNVIAVRDGYDEARRLSLDIATVRTEMIRRIRATEAWGDEQVALLVAGGAPERTATGEPK